MDTEELREDQAHDLLATAFGDDVPVVNLVPGAVEGFRRHRRRTRVLGTAGGALALTGAIVAGTALALGGGTGDGSSAAPGNRGGGVDKCRVPEAVIQQAGWDAAMVRTVTSNCETNMALIEHAIPGAKVAPSTYQGMVKYSANPHPKTNPDARYYPIIAYDITVHRHTVTLNLVPSNSKLPGCDNGCGTDTTLYNGLPGREYNGPQGGVQKGWSESVLVTPSNPGLWFFATVHYPAGAPKVFDFHAFAHSQEFAELFATSTLLMHSTAAWAGAPYVGVDSPLN